MESLDLPVDLDKLSDLARQFAGMDMFHEAQELFELALRIDPHNRGLQLGLANIRQQLKQEKNVKEDDNERALRERFRRNAIDACHFFGLAALYRDRGKKILADECLEIALGKEPIHPSAYKLRGRMLFADRDYDGAREALRTSRRFNPFDRKTAELLGRVEYE
ncbi:MAG: tetratricopeptide repeat protein, partial [Acidobacteriota bacterium]